VSDGPGLWAPENLRPPRAAERATGRAWGWFSPTGWKPQAPLNSQGRPNKPLNAAAAPALLGRAAARVLASPRGQAAATAEHHRPTPA